MRVSGHDVLDGTSPRSDATFLSHARRRRGRGFHGFSPRRVPVGRTRITSTGCPESPAARQLRSGRGRRNSRRGRAWDIQCGRASDFQRRCARERAQARRHHGLRPGARMPWAMPWMTS
jgi:hypothetical protein